MNGFAQLTSGQCVEHVRWQRGAVQLVVHADVGHRQVGRAQRGAGGQIVRGDQHGAGIAGADPEGDRSGQGRQGEEDADERAWVGASRPPKGSGGRQGGDDHGIRGGLSGHAHQAGGAASG